jgi:putative membrane protein
MGFSFGMMGGIGWLGGFFGIAFLVLLGWIVFVVVRETSRRQRKETPVAILRRRYAQGQITKEEFEETWQALKVTGRSRTR